MSEQLSLQKLIDKFLLVEGEDTNPGVPEGAQEVMCDILMNNDDLLLESVEKLMEFNRIGHLPSDVYQNGKPIEDITLCRVDWYVHWELLGGITAYALKQRKNDKKLVSKVEEIITKHNK